VKCERGRDRAPSSHCRARQAEVCEALIVVVSGMRARDGDFAAKFSARFVLFSLYFYHYTVNASAARRADAVQYRAAARARHAGRRAAGTVRGAPSYIQVTAVPQQPCIWAHGCRAIRKHWSPPLCPSRPGGTAATAPWRPLAAPTGPPQGPRRPCWCGYVAWDAQLMRAPRATCTLTWRNAAPTLRDGATGQGVPATLGDAQRLELFQHFGATAMRAMRPYGRLVGRALPSTPQKSGDLLADPSGAT